MWELDFISKEDFYEHIKNTISKYGENGTPNMGGTVGCGGTERRFIANDGSLYAGL